MAGRCACSSPPSTGVAAQGSGCVTVTGAGTPASPFTVGLTSSCLPLKTCTSSTRPGTPSQGQVIFETDTGFVRFWNGAKWKLLNPIAGGGQNGAANPLTNVQSGDAATLNYVHPWSGGEVARLDIIARIQVTGTNGDHYRATVADNVGGSYGAMEFDISNGVGQAGIPCEPAIVSGALTLRIALAKVTGTNNGVSTVLGDLFTHLSVSPLVIN